MSRSRTPRPRSSTLGVAARSANRVVVRREFLHNCALGALTAGLSLAAGRKQAAAQYGPGVLPNEPLEIGTDPQFLFDLHTVDCTWALREHLEPVKRVFHAAEKHAANPLLTGDQPSHLWTIRDADGTFRLYYQLNDEIKYPGGRVKGQKAYQTSIGYAESTDGVHWERPNLDLFADFTGDYRPPRNILRFNESAPESSYDAPQIVEAPESERRGYRYLMFHQSGGRGNPARGLRLIGSHDGIHWDPASDTLLSPIPSDHHNTVIYDPTRGDYSMYLRAKHIYLAAGQTKDRLESGQSRRGVARITSPSLWEGWGTAPQTIMVPDEVDAAANYDYFYGMPVRRYAGINWGFVQSFRMNDYMHVQLAWSRDGVNFERLPWRPKIIEYGDDGAWDDTMILACPNWIEVGDEWWIYYNGWDGPHETTERIGAIGLAKLRKEGFVSLRGPTHGGVVCTRPIRWPGGDLVVNAAAADGELRVRVSDELRRPIEGFNYDDGQIFSGDSVSHVVKWQARSLNELRDRPVRLEFFVRDADLYAFRAAGA